MSVAWRSARTVRIHCPVAPEVYQAILRGDIGAIERDSNVAKILAVVRADNPLGDFGAYQGVFEVSIGIEGFTPTSRARPAFGKEGATTLSPSVVITTYVAATVDEAAVSACLNQLIQMHPWETPVVEISDGTVRLPVRSSSGSP